MIIDTHCHLAFPDFLEDIDAVLERADALEVKKMVSISCGGNDLERTLEISRKHPHIFSAVGLHPNHCHTEVLKQYEQAIATAAEYDEVVAIGETGLDFYHAQNPSKEEQERAFSWHIALAKKVQKPVIIHLRDAEREARDFLHTQHDFPFVVHCYTGDWSFAEEILNWGGMIGIGGIITFKNCNPELREVAQKTPLDRILLETDAPYLAPMPNRGKRNEPGFTKYVAEFLAELRGLSRAEIAERTTKNAEEFFHI